MSINTIFLIFIIGSGLFGVWLGFYDRRIKRIVRARKALIRGCIMMAGGSIGLALSLSGILPGWAVILGIGMLLVIQENVIARSGRFDDLVSKPIPKPKEEETSVQQKKKGFVRFVLVNTALYGAVGISFTAIAFFLAPKPMPLYIPIAIVLAIAFGGATAAIRQWRAPTNSQKTIKVSGPKDSE